MTLSLCVSERHHAKSKRGGKDHGGVGIACVLRVSASGLGSLKPFNKREEEKREGQLEEEDFGSTQPPLTLFLIKLSFPPHPPIFSLLISSPPYPFFFRHPLPSRSSFIYPFPPQSAARSLAGCVHALVFVGCTFHWQTETIMDSTWSFNPLTIGSVGQEARGGDCSVFVCVFGLGTLEYYATNTHWQPVTLLILHTGFHSQLHSARTHTHTRTCCSQCSLSEPGEGVLIDFESHLM